MLSGLTVRSWRLWAAVTTLVMSVSCGGSSPAPAAPSGPSSGPQQLVSEDLTVGMGATAVNGRLLVVDYTGWLYDDSRPENKGTQFDTSIGGQPFSFILGTGQVISGWDLGVGGMQVGGVRRLTIPSQLAYGPAGFPPAVPGNAALVFEITLLSVQ
jgi:FKBP-type peptidyl-prolyl cis-trans isomerase FkpA